MRRLGVCADCLEQRDAPVVVLVDSSLSMIETNTVTIARFTAG